MEISLVVGRIPSAKKRPPSSALMRLDLPASKQTGAKIQLIEVESKPVRAEHVLVSSCARALPVLRR